VPKGAQRVAVPPAAAAGTAASLAAARAAADRRLRIFKVLVFCGGLLPALRLLVLGLRGSLGADPIAFLTLSTGLWTLVLLCTTLALTPLRRLSGIQPLARVRRMLGLFTFFYAALHFTTYLWFDQWFDLRAIGHDILRRPFIMVGFLAFVLLAVLAATSPRAMVRRLGRNWTRLHKAVYAIAVLAILHFWWIKAGKHDLLLPKIYGAIVLLLLALRLVFWLGKRASATRGARTAVKNTLRLE
jgi:sulfoxide reductase heme-binding subunit YedZ